jgi:copper chaperone CopZ
MCVGCGQASSTAPASGLQSPAPSSAPSEPPPTVVPTATPASTATPTLALSPTPPLTPTAQEPLITEDIKFSGALSVEDLNTLLLGIRALPGVQDAQGGVQDLLITYDPTRVTRQKIVEVIQSYGYTVKE